MALVKSPQYGGNGGAPFDDVELALPEGIVKIVQLIIRHGALVDAVQAKYRLKDGELWTAPKHGGDGGAETILNFASDEEVAGFILKSGGAIDNITVVTRQGDTYRQYGPFGGNGGAQHAVFGKIVALYGRSGGLLDALGFWGHPPLSSSLATPSAKELELEAKAFKEAKLELAVK
jgi:hypothetical protein